jgi:hypothetical protein
MAEYGARWRATATLTVWPVRTSASISTCQTHRHISPHATHKMASVAAFRLCTRLIYIASLPICQIYGGCSSMPVATQKRARTPGMLYVNQASFVALKLANERFASSIILLYLCLRLQSLAWWLSVWLVGSDQILNFLVRVACLHQSIWTYSERNHYKSYEESSISKTCDVSNS